MQPMALRSPAISYDQLHHFTGGALWNSAPLEDGLCRQSDALDGGTDAWLIIDDTALPKNGRSSVGVAPQYASALGKNANCQTLVSVTLASSEVPVMIGLRLFLPEIWTSDAARMDRAKVPAEARFYRTKPEIALADVAMIFPVAGRGRPRKNHVPDVPSRPAQDMLESAKWQTVSWRRGTKGKLSARLAAMRVFYYETHVQLREHLANIAAANN